MKTFIQLFISIFIVVCYGQNTPYDEVIMPWNLTLTNSKVNTEGFDDSNLFYGKVKSVRTYENKFDQLIEEKKFDRNGKIVSRLVIDYESGLEFLDEYNYDSNNLLSSNVDCVYESKKNSCTDAHKGILKFYYNNDNQLILSVAHFANDTLAKIEYEYYPNLKLKSKSIFEIDERETVNYKSDFNYFNNDSIVEDRFRNDILSYSLFTKRNNNVEMIYRKNSEEDSIKFYKKNIYNNKNQIVETWQNKNGDEKTILKYDGLGNLIKDQYESKNWKVVIDYQFDECQNFITYITNRENSIGTTKEIYQGSINEYENDERCNWVKQTKFLKNPIGKGEIITINGKPSKIYLRKIEYWD